MEEKTITRTSYGYEIRFPYNKFLIGEIKERIPGRRYRGQAWYAPASSKRELEAFARLYGFQMDGVTEDPFKNVPMPELLPMPELHTPLNLKGDLFPFQKQGVQYLLDHPKCICGDKPGLGKTAQAIAAVCAANAFPCLVICPSSLKYNWQTEIEKKWTDKKAVILEDRVKDTLPFLYQCGMGDFFITNYESLKKYFVASIDKNPHGTGFRLAQVHFKKVISMFKSVIIDEAHRCKDATTQQTKFCKGITIGKEYVYLLTGTPVVNKPDDLIPLLGILDKIGKNKHFDTFAMFKMCYCNTSNNWSRLNVLLRNDCYYSREKKDVLTQLPDKTRIVVPCDITTRSEYNVGLNDLAIYLKDYKKKTDPEIIKSMRGEVMVKMGVLKNISARGKIPAITEYVGDLIEAGEKIILFVHLREVAQALKTFFPNAATILGEDSAEEREASVQRFQNDPACNVIICSIKAAGVGLTLTAASTVGFVELPWHGADCEQCEDRAHRIGQKKAVNCVYFLGRNTIDEHIYQIIIDKMEMSRQITGEKNRIETSTIDDIIDLLDKTLNNN